MQPTGAQPAPGWYPDPAQGGALRWWDGHQWTAHVQPYGQQPPPDDAATALRWVVPVGRSGLAIAAGYLGLLAVLVLPAPLALGCGIAALVDIKHNPKKLGRGRAIFGIVMGGLFTPVLLISIVSAFV